MDLIFLLPCDVFDGERGTATLVVSRAGIWVGSALDMALCARQPRNPCKGSLRRLQLLPSSGNVALHT